MSEPTLAVPFRELIDIETRDGQVVWWCGLPQDCAAANVPAPSESEARSASGSGRDSVLDCWDPADDEEIDR